MQAFGEYLHSRLLKSYRRIQAPNRLRLIGRTTHVNLPEFGVKNVLAKIDTGAYHTALHAKNIHEEVKESKKVLVFDLLDGHNNSSSSASKCIAYEYDMIKVMSSNGLEQLRYRIKTYISINGIRMKTKITLTDR
jgi:hypothetical protein